MLLWVHIPYILVCHMQIDADPDLAYYFDADPDPTFQFDVDPCGFVSTTLAARHFRQFKHF
jgi:hypothetical protein